MAVDYNTIGLTGPTKGITGSWLSWLRERGLPRKSVDSLAPSDMSLAPFCLSEIRTIFYLSFIQENGSVEKRFQGKSILQSHYLNEEKELSQGVGYFGYAHDAGCDPCFDDDIPDWALKIREDVSNRLGTTIIVPYFRLDKTELPETAISCIGNFFYAIDKGNLEVDIESEVTLTQQNIRKNFRAYKERLTLNDFIDYQKWKTTSIAC